MDSIYKLFEHLKESKICLSYFGSFDDSVTDKLTGISETYLENSDELGKMKNKVSFLIAESFQNVVRHGAIDKSRKALVKNHKDFFQINAFKNRVLLSSSNLIAHAETADLEKNIEKLNSLTVDELKVLYTDVLENNEFSDKGGAGLGLIEMARKSGLPLKYHFNSIDSTHWQFFLALEIINRNEKTEPKISIKSVVEFYEILLKRNCLILYKGDVSEEVILPLIEILHGNYMADGVISSKERQSVETLIEIIKNVSKHGKALNSSRPGIFSISELNNSFSVECGNFIEQSKVAAFKKYLSSIEKMTLDEITHKCTQHHLFSQSQEDSLGLGLLEIIKNSDKNFSYKFVETPENEVFFSIKINL